MLYLFLIVIISGIIASGSAYYIAYNNGKNDEREYMLKRRLEDVAKIAQRNRNYTDTTDDAILKWLSNNHSRTNRQRLPVVKTDKNDN